MQTKNKTAYIIDGHAMCYRAFYAIRELTNSKGQETNAIYGVVTMLKKWMRTLKPDYFAVTFDLEGATFRHDQYDQYKAQRSPMPSSLSEQIEKIRELIKAYNIPIYEKQGFEADDVFGTLATELAKQNIDVHIVTSDKDAMQLVGPHVFIFNPSKEETIGVAQVCEKFSGLGPERIIDIMALTGDASDNIPGVKGIGPKTAITLIQKWDSIDGLYANLDKVSNERQRNLLKEYEKEARMSRELVTIDCAVPIEYDLEAMRVGEPNTKALMALFEDFEFRTFLKELAPASTQTAAPRKYKTLQTIAELEKEAKRFAGASQIAVDTETTSVNAHLAHLIGLSFSISEGEAFYVPVSSSHHQGPGIPLEQALDLLRPILESEKPQKIGQNIKYDLIVLKKHGVQLAGIQFDTMIASYLINPARRAHNLDALTAQYLGEKKISFEELVGVGRARIEMDQVPLEKITEYACEDADTTFRLAKILGKRLEQDDLQEVFATVEMPLVEVLARIEENGVALDCPCLDDLSQDCAKQLDNLTIQIYKLAGEEFNINSPKQLAEILFVKLGLEPVKKTKTGASTDVEVLTKLASEHELPALLLEYRERSKLKSTYLDSLPQLINPETGRIHTSFNQAVTVTGRLSSSDPNLQNIPMRTELGRNVRKSFIPREKGHLLLAADYSQIELRLLAHYSSDPVLIEAFRANEDIHKATAALLYDVELKNVTREMRSLAKTINFSIIYGKTPYGLSQDLRISVSEADEFIHAYFKRYPKVSDYLESQKELAHRQGYVTTILGRRAYFPDIQSRNRTLRQFSERAAINAPLQGSAADLIKLAMIGIDRALSTKRMQALMIMQVHDELVFDFPKSEEADLKELVVREMEGALSLKVPLKVDVFIGESWYK